MRKWSKVPRKPNIYKYDTEKGKRYGIRYWYTDSLNKGQEYTKSGFSNPQEAEIVLTRFRETLLTNGPDVLRGRRVTIDQFFQQMKKRKLSLNVWRESTSKNATEYYENYIKSIFGDTNLDDLNRAQYQSFLDDLSKKKLAKSTIHTINSIMMEMLNSAEEESIIMKNKLRGMQINGKAPLAQVLEKSDFEHWISIAEKILDRYELAMIYVGTLGERRGEIMGLRTTSINFGKDNDGKDIASIKIDLQRNQESPNGGPLKTASSYRTIWVEGEIINQLKFAILTADNIRKRNSVEVDGKISKPWLWVNSKGEPLHYTHLNRLTSRVNKKAGISVHPHLLRHYFATQAIAGKSPAIDVMHYLGHKNLQMTAAYTRPTKAAGLNVFKSVDPLNNK